MRRGGSILAATIVLIALCASPARACSAAVYVSPEAEQAWGGEIRQALGMLTAASGMTFTQSAVHADADILVGSPAAAGENALGWYREGTIVLAPHVAREQGQTPRRLHNERLRLVLHELMHWLGFEHGEWDNVMYYRITEAPVRFGPSDSAGLSTLCKVAA